MSRTRPSHPLVRFAKWIGLYGAGATLMYLHFNFMGPSKMTPIRFEKRDREMSAKAQIEAQFDDSATPLTTLDYKREDEKFNSE